MSSNPRTFARSFAGGEVTPEFFGRIDDVKFQTGLAACRNFIIKPHGPVENRPGFALVAEVKDSTKKTRIIPFVYASDQSLVIEVGEGYFRFHTNGGTLLAPVAVAYDSAHAYVAGDLASSGGVTYYCRASTTGHAPPNATYWYPLPSTAYEMPNPYAEADLATIRFTQSNDVLTLTHPGYPPAELRRNGATDWTYVALSFASVLAKPTNLSATAKTAGSPPGTPTLQSYVVTAVRSAEESPSSSEI